jgi:hypothetical protein
LAKATHVVYDVCGAAYDPGAYIAGIPECWVAFQEAEEKCGIRIVFDGTISSGVKKDTKIKMGIAAAALIMALDSAGHPVTVDLFFGGKQYYAHGKDITKNREDSCFIRLQDGLRGHILDVDRLLYALAHPLPMRGMAHTLWGDGTMPFSRNQTPKDTKGDFDLWLGGGHLDDVDQWEDDGEEWVTMQYLEQTKA